MQEVSLSSTLIFSLKKMYDENSDALFKAAGVTSFYFRDGAAQINETHV